MLDNAHADKRRAPRTRTILGAKILLDNKLSSFDCSVRSRSDTGLLIEMENTEPVPDEFSLLLGPEKIRCRCRVAWRKATRLGVEITEFADDATAEGGAAGSATSAASATTSSRRASPSPEIVRRLTDAFPHLVKKPWGS